MTVINYEYILIILKKLKYYMNPITDKRNVYISSKS